MDSSLPNLGVFFCPPLRPYQLSGTSSGCLHWMHAVVVSWLECVELMTVACTTDDTTTYVVPLGKVACMI